MRQDSEQGATMPFRVELRLPQLSPTVTCLSLSTNETAEKLGASRRYPSPSRQQDTWRKQRNARTLHSTWLRGQ